MATESEATITQGGTEVKILLIGEKSVKHSFDKMLVPIPQPGQQYLQLEG